jgi:hypothetical protein
MQLGTIKTQTAIKYYQKRVDYRRICPCGRPKDKCKRWENCDRCNQQLQGKNFKIDPQRWKKVDEAIESNAKFKESFEEHKKSASTKIPISATVFPMSANASIYSSRTHDKFKGIIFDTGATTSMTEDLSRM